MKKLALLLFLALTAASLKAQTTLTVPYEIGCGNAQIFNCYGIAFAQGGSVWVDIYGNSNFLDFYSAGPSHVSGVTTTVVSSFGNNSINIAFSGTDANTKLPFSGTATFYFHTEYRRGGGGRGGGGGGTKLFVDSGTLTFN